VSTASAPASAKDAVAMVRAGMSYLAAADLTGLTAAEQADCLVEMEQNDAIGTVARAWMLGAFTAGQGPAADADRSPRAWLIHKTGVTPGCAAGHVGWARRAAAHPLVAAALAQGGRLTESMARTICTYTDKLPAADRDKADVILLGVAAAGARQDDIARLAAQMYERSRSDAPDADPGDPDAPDADPGDPDASDDDADGPDGPDGPDDGRADPDDGFDDRSVRLETTLGGAGVLYGDLTPECSALVATVLDALSARAGAEDTRTRAQRYHDALAEALRRLVAADLLPDRAGSPTKALVHVSLAELRSMHGGSRLEEEWVARAQEDWAGHRAAASVTGGDGAAWLGGATAAAVCCDAILVPVVTGQVDPSVLDRLVDLCLELADHGHGRCQPITPRNPAGTAEPENQSQESAAPERGAPGPAAPEPGTTGDLLTAQARQMLLRGIIGAAIDLVSGPGGLASVLRTGQLGARLAGPSLPLDVGYSDTVPAAIRQAVTLRAGGHCEWAGGCWQPAPACHLHHVTRKADGGRTSVTGCLLLCSFHHLVAVHRWGWRLTLNPDGTTTARSPDGTKVLHSHSPPARAG
jgi:hypothetical protein